MIKSFYTVALLTIANLFMTFAWHGHLPYKKIRWLHGLGLVGVILVSWSLAFFAYVFQVPANRIGFEENGGPFNLFQLKVMQEAVSLTVFFFCAGYVFKTDKLAWNPAVGFALLVAAVYGIFPEVRR